MPLNLKDNKQTTLLSVFITYIMLLVSDDINYASSINFQGYSSNKRTQHGQNCWSGWSLSLVDNSIDYRDDEK